MLYRACEAAKGVHRGGDFFYFFAYILKLSGFCVIGNSKIDYQPPHT
jgi:hypothetical protein